VIEFPDVIPGDPVAVSASLYMTFARCPNQALGRLHGVYPEESTASFRGGLAHRVFARHLVNGPISPSDFSGACRAEIGSALNPKLGALGLKPSQLASVISEVGDLYTRFKALSVEGFRTAECYIEIEPAAGVTLRGSVDAVFDDADGVRLVDWKTGGLYETEQQLGFYALLWSIERCELPARVEAISIGSGERISSVPTRASITQTAGEVAGIVSDLRKAISSGTDELPRIGGPWCRYCPLLTSCNEGSAAARLLH